MDPIEKLLNDLRPARAPGGLDQTMGRLFTRADRRARLRRAVRSLVALGAMLAVGLAAGYHLGSGTVSPVAVPSVTYLVPLDGAATTAVSAISSSATRATRSHPREGSIMVTILERDAA